MPTTLSNDPLSTEIVLVIGATGRTGALIVDRLLEQNFSVRALARDAKKANSTLPADVEIFTGNVRDISAVTAAIEGVAKIIFCATAAAGGSSGNTPDVVDYGGVVAAVTAAQSVHVQHFVLISSAATTQPEHPHNVMFKRILKWKFKGEQYLRNSGLTYSVIRPLGLRDYDGNVKGIRFVQGDRIACGEEIARADVAALCVAVLGVEQAFNKTFEAYNDARIEPGIQQAAFADLRLD